MKMFMLKLSNVLFVMLSLHYYQTLASTTTEDYTNAGLRTVLRIYDECSKTDGGFVPCLKKKTITFLDRISSIDAINFGDGIKIIRIDGATKVSRALSENELESTLPRGNDDRDSKLTNLLIERISQFFSGHTLQISLPRMSPDELGRGLEEGRGKMKKMAGMMMMGMAMKLVGLIPIAIAALYVLAGKALIVSKIALLLAGIIGLKKLLSSKGSGGGASGWSSGGSSGGWPSSGGGGGGWDRRSLNEAATAQNLAYSAYSKQ